MSVRRGGRRKPRWRINWQRSLLHGFTWVLLAVFVLTSVGVALVAFAYR